MKPDPVHTFHIIGYAKKQGYTSKANALCPLLIGYAKEWRACSAADFIEKADMCLDHEQKWAVQGGKVTTSGQLRTLFDYSTRFSYSDIQKVFDEHPVDRRGKKERLLDHMSEEDYNRWTNHLKEVEESLIPYQEQEDSLSPPTLNIDKLT